MRGIDGKRALYTITYAPGYVVGSNMAPSIGAYFKKNSFYAIISLKNA